MNLEQLRTQAKELVLRVAATPTPWRGSADASRPSRARSWCSRAVRLFELARARRGGGGERRRVRRRRDRQQAAAGGAAACRPSRDRARPLGATRARARLRRRSECRRWAAELDAARVRLQLLLRLARARGRAPAPRRRPEHALRQRVRVDHRALRRGRLAPRSGFDSPAARGWGGPERQRVAVPLG